MNLFIGLMFSKGSTSIGLIVNQTWNSAQKHNTYNHLFSSDLSTSSIDYALLVIPQTIGEPAFPDAGPIYWNPCPASVHSVPLLVPFL